MAGDESGNFRMHEPDGRTHREDSLPGELDEVSSATTPPVAAPAPRAFELTKRLSL